MKIALLLGLTLALPATALAQDGDADGVPDGADAFPCDAGLSAAAYAPARGAFGLLLFEDQFPSQGDLDFNDLVVAYHFEARMDGTGVRVLRAVLDVLAAGGANDNGLGLHLPIPRSAAGPATLTIGTSPAQTLLPSTSDAELTYAVLDDVRVLFGGASQQINSRSDLARREVTRVVIEIPLAANTTVPMNEAPFDLFLFRSSNPSHQVHLPRYGGTAAFDATLFGSGDDGSAPGRWFVDQQGLPFALNVPIATPYPAEGTAISQLFPRIVDFAASGGASATDFYTTPIASAQYTDANGAGAPTPTTIDEGVDLSCVSTCTASLFATSTGDARTIDTTGTTWSFCAQPGDRRSLEIAFSGSCVDVEIRDPNGALIQDRLDCSTYFTDLLPITVGGRYDVFARASSGSGTATATLHDVPADVDVLVTLPSTTPVTITHPGQDAFVRFDGAQGDRVSIDVGSGAGCHYSSVTAPSGAILFARALACGSRFLDAVVLPENGRYVIHMDPHQRSTPSLDIRAFDVPPDVTVATTLGSAPVSLHADVPGQNAEVQFDASAGTRASFYVRRGGGGCAYMQLVAPDGSSVHARSLSCGSRFLEPVVLPLTGTYRLVLDGHTDATPSFVVEHYLVPPDFDVVGQIGQTTAVGSGVPGRNGRVSFDATAGQRIAVRTIRSNGCFYVRLLAPSGAELYARRLSCGSHFVDATDLTETGTYVLALDPSSSDVIDFDVTLYDVPAEPFVATTLGVTASLALTTPGLNGSVTFDAVAGTSYAVLLDRDTGCFYTSLHDPSGTEERDFGLGCGDRTIVVTPATSGVYEIYVDPNGADTPSFAVRIDPA